MLPCHKFCPDTHTSPKQLSISTVCCTGTLFFFFFFYKLHLADHSSTPARRRHFVHNILSNSSLFKSQQAFEMSSRMSTASTLIGPPIKTNTNTVKPDASTPEIEPEYKDKDLETALRTALRTNVKLFTRRTSSGKKIDTSYLTIAKLAAEELGIEAELFYGKTWWKKVMETINDEIVSPPPLPLLPSLNRFILTTTRPSSQQPSQPSPLSKPPSPTVFALPSPPSSVSAHQMAMAAPRPSPTTLAYTALSRRSWGWRRRR